MKHETRKEKANQILDLMDSLDLEAAIRADLYLEWTQCKTLADREQIYLKEKVVDNVFKQIRRLAGG